MALYSKGGQSKSLDLRRWLTLGGISSLTSRFLRRRIYSEAQAHALFASLVLAHAELGTCGVSLLLYPGSPGCYFPLDILSTTSSLFANVLSRCILL